MHCGFRGYGAGGPNEDKPAYDDVIQAATGVGDAQASFMLLDRQGGWVQDPPTGPTGYARTDSPFRRPYRTTDGYVAVMVCSDKHWRSFVTLIGRPELAQDVRFADVGARTRHINELYEIVELEMLNRSTAAWMELLDAADVPNGPVNSIILLNRRTDHARIGLCACH